MKKITASIGLLLLLSSIQLFAQQDPPNDVNASPNSANATAAGRLASTPINLYTGIPSISIPLYQYSHHNGLNLSVSLDYFSGGVKMAGLPTTAGLNWYLSAGGVIARTVRGVPDEVIGLGYHYNATLPADPTVNARAYYHDSSDAELDVFQYNFNGRSGKFYIGKDKQVLFAPLSKMKVSYDTSIAYDGSIVAFRITTEDGVKYVFNDFEWSQLNSDPYKCGYDLYIYSRSWYLSQIIAPFGTDTIKFAYSSQFETNGVAFPQTVYVRTSDLNATQKYAPSGTQIITVKKLKSIVFPDKKTISLIYSDSIRYDGLDSVLDKIKISDSVFRYGYLFDWQYQPIDTPQRRRDWLAGIRYYTHAAMRPEYKFAYTGTPFPAVGISGDNLYGQRDNWGFYNAAANNGNNTIPTIAGVYTGANRDPSPTAALSNTLSSITDPSGGITYYQFESNDLPQYTNSPQGVYIPNALVNTQNSITLSQVFGDKYTFYLNWDILYPGTVLSGSCNFVCSVTSLDGSVTYGSISTTLNKVASGVSFPVVAPNGNYLVKTSISGCSSTLSSLAIDIDWQNQLLSGTAMTSGGIRLKQQSHYDPVTGRTDTIATYNYKQTDGTSSGFLGAVPVYTYPYQQTVVNGGTTTTNYTAISSDPINDLNYTQGSPVGYSRVEVVKGSPTNNIGKEVYEFTGLGDAGTGLISPFFPYAPLPQRDWAMGLPRRVTTYDNTGRLISIKNNTYKDSLFIDSNINYLSRKFGKKSITYFSNPTSSTEVFASQDYYPETGRAFLTRTVDSFYHSDNSLQVVEQDLQYDTNYNVTKVTAPYDPSRGLFLEKRLYYPYNYTVSGAIGKLRDSGIITAPVAIEQWITGDANPRMVGAQITDFQQLPQGEIKPKTIYSLQSNAPVPQGTIGNFDPTSLVRNTTYFVPQQSFVTYDAGGNLLETKNALSGQSNSVIMDYFNQFPVAKVTNATSSDIAYTSFESDGTGNWTIGGTARNNTTALTGKNSYNLSGGSITKSGLNTSISYLVSVWANSGAVVTVNGNSMGSSIAQQNGWNLYQTVLSGASTITLAGTGLIDELRLHPKDANMATATFEPMIGLTSTADDNNTVSYTFYDSLNRVKFLKDKDLNVVKKYDYSDNLILISYLPVWQNTGLTQCETPSNGNIDRQQQNINPFSPTYKSTQWVFDHTDCAVCKPPCSGNSKKLIGCNCETGVRANLTTSKSGTQWKCTFMYCWSDGSGSATFTEFNSSPCTIQGTCL